MRWSRYGFTASATDPDLPANTLAFSLIGAPTGAGIDPVTGEFSWTPAESQGPGVYTFTVKVTDNGDPSLSDEQEVELTVLEVNRAPELAPVGNKAVDEGSTLTFTASATDPDLPANTLAFSLANGTTNCFAVTTCLVPAGATIDPATGAFSWTPPDNGTFRFNIVVTDNGSPVAHDAEELTVTVANVAPVVTAPANQTANEGENKSLNLGSFTDAGVNDGPWAVRVDWATAPRRRPSTRLPRAHSERQPTAMATTAPTPSRSR